MRANRYNRSASFPPVAISRQPTVDLRAFVGFHFNPAQQFFIDQNQLTGLLIWQPGTGHLPR